MPALPLLDVRTRQAWRRWLASHHARTREIWLVYHKSHTGTPSLGYGESVEEALCFGWVDSLIRRLDDERYARKFTPRQPDSAWSSANRRRYEALRAQGRLALAGRRRAPTARSGDRPVLDAAVVREIEAGLRRHRAAWRTYSALAPSHRRAYALWIGSAKRPETRRRRLHQAVARLTAGETLGLTSRVTAQGGLRTRA